MALLSVARPIENIDSAVHAKVLAVIDHLMPMLSDWRLGEDLRSDIAATEQKIRDAQTELKGVKSKLIETKTQLAAVKSMIFGKLPIALLVGGVVGGALIAISAFSFGIVLAIALVGIGLFVSKSAGSKQKTYWFEQLAGVETKFAQLDSSVTSLISHNANLAAQLSKRAVGFPEINVADVRFGLEGAEIAGHKVLLDLSGVHTEATLKAVDVSGLQTGLTHISDRVRTLLSVPPLLTPGAQAETDDPVHALFGEEDQLQDMVSEFTVNLGKLRDVTLKLPLVPKESVLIQRLNAGAMNVTVNQTAINLMGKAGNVDQIQSFVNEVNQTKINGQKVFQELADVFSNLESACNLYANARITSVNTIHENLIEVLNRAAWCNRKFYCPRTIQSPKYLEDLLGLDPKKAYLLSLDDLIGRLRSDGEVCRRLDAKPEIEEQLTEAYYGVQEFMGGVSFDQHGGRIDTGSRPKHIEQQFQEAIRQFSNVFQKALTGTTYPILNFSTEAQLYYEPESDEWASKSAPYVYGTADALKYGSVVKAYADLMLPMWEHLWTEKTDFRKSELFRTNESMIRMSEKESEKLINIADQFRADMRTVRENVYLIESDLKSKYSEIISFRDGMDQLGLLSVRAKESVTDEKLQAILLGESALSSTDRYETMLSTMPQSQAENRGTVHDPIDMIKEPDALLTYRSSPSVRLLTE
jgi:hypothetical protein